MTRDELRQGVLELAAKERRQLVDELWRTLARDSKPLPDWQRTLFDYRLNKLEINPEDGETWEVVERRVWAGKEEPRLMSAPDS